MVAASCEVWWTDLDVPADVVEAMAATLDASERTRAERFRGDHLRRRYVVSHAMLRAVLAFNGAFDLGPHGKPTMPVPGAPHFNLSHSGERAVLAVCAEAEVGIDVEAVREVGQGVAERIMSPDELAAWHAAADPQRFLLETWTRKEAIVKATGEGITRSLRTLSYDDHTVVPLDLGPGYVAAVAGALPSRVDVVLRRWS